MANNSLTGVTRDQLKQFLPDHQTIIAFENLLKFAGETTPDQIEAIVSLISGIKRINATDINSRLSALETPPAGRSTNLSSIYARLEALEAAQARRANLQPIIARIENIEKTLGI